MICHCWKGKIGIGLSFSFYIIMDTPWPLKFKRKTTIYKSNNTPCAYMGGSTPVEIKVQNTCMQYIYLLGPQSLKQTNLIFCNYWMVWPEFCWSKGYMYVITTTFHGEHDMLLITFTWNMILQYVLIIVCIYKLIKLHWTISKLKNLEPSSS